MFDTISNPFLFAVGITNVNLNDPTTKYFNIGFQQRITDSAGRRRVSYTLQPCNVTEWADANPDFASSFTRLKLDQFLCLPPNISLQFQGKFSSSIFKFAQIKVDNCSISPGDNRTCANATQISSLFTTNGGALSLNYYFVNIIINPNNLEYLGNYL